MLPALSAGRSRAFLGLRELGRLERDAVQDVALRDLEPVQAVAPQHLLDDHGARDDHRRALGLEPGD